MWRLSGTRRSSGICCSSAEPARPQWTPRHRRAVLSCYTFTKYSHLFAKTIYHWPCWLEINQASTFRRTPLLKKLNRARNDLSGKIIPLFKTYQDWEKKIIFEPFDQENLAGQPTILVRLKLTFFYTYLPKGVASQLFY